MISKSLAESRAPMAGPVDPAHLKTSVPDRRHNTV